MEVRDGYKQTEVGIIPKDWEVKKFEDVMTGFTSGATPSRSNPDYFKGTIKWITSGELNYNVITDTIESVTDEAVKNTNLKIYTVGTFLIAITGLEAAGTRGSCGIVGVEAATNQSCMALFPIKGLLNNIYLYHYYVWQGDSLAFKYCQGTKQQSYTGKIVKELPIIIPPTMLEQRRIATTLSDTDALINSLEKLVTKKLNIKQGAMQKLLCPKKSWEEKTLGDCLLRNPEYGINAAAARYDDNLPRYLRITDISDDGRYIKENEVSVNHPLSRLFILDPGDIVFARTGASVGKGYLHERINGELVFAGFLIRFKLNKEILNPYFFKYISQTAYYWNWVASTSMRTGQPGLNSNEYKSFNFNAPDITEQTRIATILSDMDAEITALQSKLEKYKNIKAGMMQQLLTGKIRLI